MELIDYNYQSEGLINKEISYELSALIDADSLFYGIIDYRKQLKRAVRVGLHNLDNQALTSQIDYSIRKTKVAFLSNQFCLVPTHEYSNNYGAELLWHGQKDADSDYILRNDYCEKFDLRVIYSIRRDDIYRFQDSTSPIALHHFVTACLETCDTTNPSKKVKLMIFDHKLLILVHEGKRLLICNVYDYNEPTTLLYYVSLVYEQMKLDRQSQSVEIAGLLTSKEDTFHLLKKYFGNISFADYGLSLDGFQAPHVYHPLYCVSQCVS